MKNHNKDIKNLLYEQCSNYIDQRIASIQRKLDEVADSRNNETKSSAGDKHETGRTMMQLEEQKATVQLYSALDIKQILDKINIEKVSVEVVVGSLVYCDKANYFLAISAGKMIIDSNTYYGISLQSPIGAQLSGKQVGDQINFNGRSITIEKII